jgi:D-xylose transport system permease protein
MAPLNQAQPTPRVASATRHQRSLLHQLGVATGGTLPIIVALVIVWAFFQTLNAHFLSARNLTNLLLQISSTGIITTGVVLVLLVGEIDLSIGSVAGVSAAILALLVSVYSVPWWLAIIAMIAVGGGIGAIQGTWLVMFGVPSFIVTLGGLLGWYGVQLYLIQTQRVDTIMVEDPHIVAIATTFLPKPLGWSMAGVVGLGVVASRVAGYRRRQAAGFIDERASEAVVRTMAILVAVIGGTVVLDQWRGIPIAAVIFIGLVAAFSWIAQRTPFGRYIYAIGGNPNGAHRAGINVRALRIVVFSLSGTLAALGGLVAVARLSAADTGTGGGTVLLEAIASAVIGGISLFGGRGSVWAALFGSLVIGSVSNGLDLTGNEATVKYMVEGLILVIAVTADVVSRRRRLWVETRT